MKIKMEGYSFEPALFLFLFQKDVFQLKDIEKIAPKSKGISK